MNYNYRPAEAISVWLRSFMKQDASSGILLILAALVAMVLVNSPLGWLYDSLLSTPVEIRIGALHLDKPLLLWINDGLMALFFLLIGLEVKREFLEGELSKPEQIILPGLGAIGGMIMPALIYVWFNRGDELAMNGWAIPAATDIAFALGILGLLGSRVPLALRIFLMALAIFDDLGAVVVIALFYTADLSLISLVLALLAVVTMLIMNLSGVTRVSAYMVVGAFLWVAVLKSGVHATLAGVVVGMMIPMQDPRTPETSPLKAVEEGLHQWVAFLVVPLFAFANAGVSFVGISLETLLDPIPLGIAAGLFFGKQLGIMLFCALAIGLGFARLPRGSGWWDFYATSVLCGIGFTMSLFIASLAFEQGGSDLVVEGDRLGILLGSLLSALVGYLLFRFTPPRTREPE